MRGLFSQTFWCRADSVSTDDVPLFTSKPITLFYGSAEISFDQIQTV